MRAARRVIFATAVVLLASSCGAGSFARSGGDGGTPEVCTQELGIIIEPRALTLDVGDTATITVETSTCGGSIRGEPDRLRFQVADPSVATVDARGRVSARAPGETSIDVSTSSFEQPAAVTITVVRA